ncbi:MAG: TonB-dependent receptor domain-containing protein [bacterium]
MLKRTFRTNWLFFFCLLGSVAFAEDTVLRGIVTDSETGNPLPGANIVIVSDEIETGTASSVEGHFELRNVPAGQYKMTVTFIGYRKEVLENIVVSEGTSKSFEIFLSPQGIQLNPVTVTASRQPEKLLDAPSSISVLVARDVETKIALTAAEHLKSMPAVDIITAGLNQSRIVIRGFNDLLSGSLLSLIDYRITRIPAVRLNAFQLIPIGNEDVERVEVVSGPASALYGPNSANGVVHVVTKSPFDSKGTSVSIGGGEQSVLMGTVRHAGTLNDKIGYKFSMQYYKGDDFESIDSTEIKILEREKTLTNRPDTLRIGRRIFDIESTNFDGRVDFRLSPDLTLIVNGGFSRGDNIEITDQGAAQALNAGFRYLQARLTYKDFFLHSFFNQVKTDDTYFLRNGQTIINNSSLFAVQAQHNLAMGNHQRFTYGLDVLLTRPDTEGTINGRNEHDDDVNEIGVYLQSETTLHKKLKLISAARIDNHNRLDGLKFSPRAALVFKPSATDNFRITFNRAFTTPSANSIFSDTVGERVLTSSDPRLATLAPFIGETLLSVRSLGTWPSGFTFRYGGDSRPQMVTAFGDTLSKLGYIPEANSYLAPDVNSVWPVLRLLFIANAREIIPDFLLDAINLEEIFPQQLSRQVPGILKVTDPESLGFQAVEQSFVRDIPNLKESTTTTLEFGYKGLINNNLLTNVDIYHTKVKDFIGPLRVETPGVYIDRQKLADVLATDLQAPDFIKNLLVDSIVNDDRIDSLAIGIISPTQVQNGTDVILTQRNLGDVSVTGFDLSLTYRLNHNWNVTGNYSFVNRDFFKSDDGLSDIALNAPKHKVGAILNYRNDRSAFDSSLRLRFVDGFPANSGIFVGAVERYAIFDFNASYRLPFSNNTRLSLSIQNLTNNKHREFVGLPEIGRLAWMRLTQML